MKWALFQFFLKLKIHQYTQTDRTQLDKEGNGDIKMKMRTMFINMVHNWKNRNTQNRCNKKKNTFKWNDIHKYSIIN